MGQPRRPQPPQAVKQVRRASSPIAMMFTGVAAVTGALSLVLFFFALDAATYKTLFIVLGIFAVTGALSIYLTYHKNNAQATIKTAQESGQVILTSSDGYRLLNDALYRAYRLDLAMLLNSGSRYNKAMLDYILDIESSVAELQGAHDRQAQLAAHKKLATRADTAAAKIAHLYAQEHTIEV